MLFINPVLTKPSYESSRILGVSARSSPSAFAVDRSRLADEGLGYFAWLGLIAKGESIEFSIEPLAEMAAAIDLAERWHRDDPSENRASLARWRVVSFAAAVARRRGWLNRVRPTLCEFIDSLSAEVAGVTAACYVVVEAGDELCAAHAVRSFAQQRHRSLSLFPNERRQSARAIANAISLAGGAGFEWFFDAYLDPRYPARQYGSANVSEIFYEWAALSIDRLKPNEVKRLGSIVKPYLATGGGGNLYGLLNVIAMLVPDAFEPVRRLWHQSLLLDNRLFASRAAQKLRAAVGAAETKQMAAPILSERFSESPSAGAIWLELNPTEEPPPSLVRAAFRFVPASVEQSTEWKVVSECRRRLGDERWFRSARYLSLIDDHLAAGGAIIALHESGERRLPLLGDVAMAAMHDGGYVAGAERVLGSLVEEAGERGVRWLAERIAASRESGGDHSGWWRVLLASIERSGDGPDLLARCISKLSGFTLPRYPEVREAFSRVVDGARGAAFRARLREELNSLDPEARNGAAMVLVSTGPETEADALFVAVRAQAGEGGLELREWGTFCLTITFGPSVLESLQVRLSLLAPPARVFGLALLAKGHVRITDRDREALVIDSLGRGSWDFGDASFGEHVLGADSYVELLLGVVDGPQSAKRREAAQRLLSAYRSQLTSTQEAKCIALSTSLSSSWDLFEVMLRVEHDPDFAASLVKACDEIRRHEGPKLFLETFVRARSVPGLWKDVVWAMLCDRSGDGRPHTELTGDALLTFGRAVKAARTAIGEAAKECLLDPRMKNDPSADAYHWLGVVADEFVGLSSEVLADIVGHGSPIHCSAATALVARLGCAPSGAKFRGRGKQPPVDPLGMQPKDEADCSDIVTRLRDYSRDSCDLHPSVLSAIEESLRLPPLPEATLAEFASGGDPGILIAATLRFTYGRSARLGEGLPLFDSGSLYWQSNSDRADLKYLLRIWKILQEGVLFESEQTVVEYVSMLDAKLAVSGSWKLSVASERLRCKTALLPEQVDGVLLQYADCDTFMHERLFAQLCRWISGTLNEAETTALVASSERAVMVLDEGAWTYGDRPNTWACLLCPAILWALGGKASVPSEAVFCGDCYSV